MPRKQPAPSSATPPTARAANGRFRAHNAKATPSSDTPKAGADLFGPASDCAPHALADAEAPACYDPATEFERMALDAEFEQFYSRYPRKRSRGFALRAFRSARKKAGFAEIMAGLERYKFDPDPGWQPYPATWLNGERWNDVEPDLTADPWGLFAWLPTAGELGWSPDAIAEICSAAGLDRSWRGDLDTIGKWLTDGYRPDSIALVLAEETTRQPVPRFLAWFDRTVRQRAFRWNETRLEWTRQRP